MALLDDMIAVFDLPNHDWDFSVSTHLIDRRLVGAAFIHWAMLSVSIGIGMASLDTAIANTALPAMADQLHATPAASAWIVKINHLAMLATLLPFAAWSETAGYRRMCIAGIALFTVAPFACATWHGHCPP